MRSTAIFVLCFSLCFGLNTIVRKGNLLFDSVTGNQFWVKGVDYQPKNSIGQNYDVLANPNTLNRDLPYLTGLGINAIRVYETNASLNHDVCMQILDSNGIYVILDVPTPTTSIDSSNPMWNLDLFAPFAAKIDAFSQYGNILGYIASNEVSNQINNTGASAFVKAAVRDVKAYVRSKGLLTPVGYAIADAGEIAVAQEQYFACSPNPDDDPDFYGINIYRWCGNDSSFEISGYNVVTETFTNWPIAVMLSEYGCNTPRYRPFDEVISIYSTNMTNVFSGGLVYEYSEEVNDYGLVVVNYANNSISPLSDWTNYKNQLAKVNPTSTNMLSTYTYTPKTIACPAINASAWQAAASPLPPRVDATFCNCILASLTCRFNADTAAALIPLAANVTATYSYLCGLNGGIYCTNISTNALTGVYGSLSACDGLTRISATMNSYYKAQPNPTADTCAFGGLGRVQTPATGACTSGSTASAGSSVTRNTITTSNSADSSMTASTSSTVASSTSSGSSQSTASTTGGSLSSSQNSRSSTQSSASDTARDSGASSLVVGGILAGVAALLL